ncbi:MAG TPA: c-type cytochrome [Candidatus Acidoferrum sp.]|nr:c-type cytochrome [Candidatus Acidoferrum sp.]
MPRRAIPYLTLLAMIVATALPALKTGCEESRSTDSGGVKLILRETRTSPFDLEVAGDLAGFPAGTVRYVTRKELLRLPQVSATVTDDANFRGPTEISGVLLATLVQNLSAKPEADLVVAICDDRYRTNYTRAYVAEHQPILVLNINGRPPDGWPNNPENSTLSMGPYLISHAKFVPGYKILSHSDEPQIPWGVVRLEFRDEEKVFGSIAPRGPGAQDAGVQAGYRIAEQNCFRCHNMGDEGGQLAVRSWPVLGTWAAASPEYFSGYIHDPKTKNPKSQMPGFPEYDAATLKALTDYFRTFGPQEKP